MSAEATLYKGTPLIQTPRLVLRRPSLEDAPDVFAYSMDELVTRYTYIEEPGELKATQAMLADTLNRLDEDRFARWHIVPRGTARVVGAIQIRYTDLSAGVAEVAYVLARAWWGQGIATEALVAVRDFAFDVMGVQRLCADHILQNAASGRVMAKAGFLFEGELRDSKLIKGELRTMRVYGMLSEDRRTPADKEPPLFRGCPPLCTPRLLLRRLSHRDAPDVFAYACDPEVTRYLPWARHTDMAETNAFIASSAAAVERDEIADWGIALRATNRVIGTIGVVRCDRDHGWAEIGYVLQRDFWNQGIATESCRAVLGFCFNEVGFHRVQARCCTDNAASARVMEKIGMKREGVSREARRLKGAFADYAHFAILRREYAP